MIATRLLKIAGKFLGGIVLLVAVAQFCAFFYFSCKSRTLNEANVIIAFAGDDNRVSAACSLTQQGYAVNLAATDTTREQLAKAAGENVINDSIRLIDGGQSRSTFEDVYRTKELIETNDFKSIIIVTSSYHMPRTYFLLKLYLYLSDLKVDIQYYSVPEKSEKQIDLRPYYNEMIKMWGSLFEMTGYKIAEEFLNDKPIFIKARTVFHSVFLFKV